MAQTGPGAYPEIWIRGREDVASPPFPFPSSFPSPPLPLPPFPIPPLPLEVGPLIQLEGLGERGKLTQRGLGRSPNLN